MNSLGYVWGMNTQPQLIHIRVDDIPLLLGLLLQMNIAELYDREVGDYKTHTGMRIPRQSCHLFHGKAATDSTAKLPLIPRQSCH